MIDFLEEKVKKVALGDLTDPEVLADLKELLGDNVYEVEPPKAKDIFLWFMEEFDFNLSNVRPVELRFILLRLFWQSLPALSSGYINSVLKENLLFSLQNGIDVFSQVKKLLRVNEFGLGPDDELRRTLRNNLETNKEVLGQAVLLLGNNQNSEPTVANWFKLYNESEKFGTNLKRSRFNQIKFLEGNRNAALLKGEEKAILSIILQIYDYILFPPPKPEIIGNENVEPGATSKIFGSQYVTKDKFTLPPQTQKTAVADGKKPVVDQIKQGLPVDLPKPLPTVSKTSFVLPKSPGLRLFEGSLEETKQIDGANKQGKTGELSQADRANIIDSAGRTNNTSDLDSIKKDIESKKNQAQAEIEKKLTSLKTRNKSAKSS